MNRADYKGFRYKPIKAGTSDDEFSVRMKQEFENIAAGQDGLIDHVNDVISPIISGAGGGGGGRSVDSDRLVGVTPKDTVPGTLVPKLSPGAGIRFNVNWASDAVGEQLTISVDETRGSLMVVCIHDFNTRVDKNGNPRTGDNLLEEVFPHPIMNEHYLFDVYRPTEDYDTAPVDTWPDGTIRGRHQIRWKSVLHKKSGLFGLRFHQPEFGTIVLYGASAVFRV